MKRSILILACGLLLVPVAAFAHAVVYPGNSRPGAYERYVLRVPNESDVPTVRIEMRFPDAVRVISFLDVPGWKVDAVMDSTGRAVSAVWSGSLPPERFIELPFIGVNPKDATSITWPVMQIYSNGERVEWAGPPGSNLPASVTVIGAATSTEETEAAEDEGHAVELALGGLAVVLAAAALFVALRQQ